MFLTTNKRLDRLSVMIIINVMTFAMAIVL